MAEFREVMRQARRLCDFYEGECRNCERGPKDCLKDMPCDESGTEQFEREILAWAAAHPEVAYPTWEEWFLETFPSASQATSCITPCHFVRKCEWEGAAHIRCCDNTCATCAKKQIPASIAEKLGVKPKEVR